MKPLDLNLPDLSGHPPPPQVPLVDFERCVLEWLACGMRPEMTEDECVADFKKNEGSQTEEWPDFGGKEKAPSLERQNPRHPLS